MSFLLAILAVVFVKEALYLLVVTVEQLLQLLILLAVQDLLHFFDTPVQSLVVISHDNDVQRFIVLKDVLLRLVCPSTPYGNATTRPFLNEFLCATLWSNDFPNVVVLCVIYCCLCKVDLLELLQGFVIFGRDESAEIHKYVLRIFMQSSISEIRSRCRASRLRT